MFRRIIFRLASSSSSNNSRRPVTSLDLHAAYRVLGLSPGAEPNQARQQYLKLARQYHPDVGAATTGGGGAKPDDSKMKALNLAYEVVQSYGGPTAAPDAVDDAAEGVRRRKRKRQQYQRGEEEGDDIGADAFGDQQQQRGGGRRRKPAASPLSDSAAWNERPEYAWRAAIFDDVSDADRANPRNHAHTFNRSFSFADDAAIYRGVRSGATVEEVARSLGKTPFIVERRMNSAQFKLRIQKLMRTKSGAGSGRGGNDIKSSRHYQHQANPARDTVYRTPRRNLEQEDEHQEERYGGGGGNSPFLHPEQQRYRNPGEDDASAFSTLHNAEDDSVLREFSVHKIASAHGRSYDHLKKFMRGGRRGGF